MSRQRPLKVYSATVYPSQDVFQALGGGHGQSRAWVVARSLKEAAALMGTNLGEWGAHLYNGAHDTPAIDAAKANPGQVILTPYDVYRRDQMKMVEVAVTLSRTNTLSLGQSDLALAEALLRQEEDRKARAKARVEKMKQEREESKAHRAQTSRSIQETLERIHPLLEELGINPQTVGEGRGSERFGMDRQGILLPAEAAERLVKMAMELEEVMGS